MKVASNLIDLIGNTPLMYLSKFSELVGLRKPLIVKIESFNPASSVKDRAALAMIEDAEKKGTLKSGGEIIEPTSGNTGIGLAWISAIKGYKLTLTMPEAMSVERRQLLAALDANIVLTDGALGMAGAIARAQELQRANPNSIILGQFDNSANPRAHVSSTGPEIWRDTDGGLDVFVAGVGTGGTVSGVGKFLKEKNKDVYIVAVEPSESPFLTKGTTGKHRIQGIGAGFEPVNYDASIVDEVLVVESETAIETTRLLSSTEGLLVGISSGAAVNAAVQVALRPENQDKTIVVLLPDTGERYLSTGIFQK